MVGALVWVWVVWIARAGNARRDLNSHLGESNSVHRQFWRWAPSGVWDAMLQAINGNGAGRDSDQMGDSTVVRAHKPAAGAPKMEGLRANILAVFADFSTKIQLRGSGLGLLVAVTLTGWHTADVRDYALMAAETGPDPRVKMAIKGSER